MTREATDAELRVVHSDAYIAEVAAGFSSEWKGQNKAMNRTNRQIVAGTVDAALRIYTGASVRAFSPMGAKHHAQYDHSSGFCVFNDMAIAAHMLTRAGWKVAYLDWDAHHGDGVENLTRDNPDILTASIHEWGIFPGTGSSSEIDKSVFNWSLGENATDVDLLRCVDEAIDCVRDFQPDVIFLASGADGHVKDPLSSLRYTYKGFAQAGRMVSEAANETCKGRILAGGAGGYCPDDYTPGSWAAVVWELVAGAPETPVVHEALSGV